MKYYGVEMIGKFKCQKYDSLVFAGAAGNEGRLIYVVDEDSLYIDDGAQWRRASKQSFITLTDCPSSYTASNLPIVNTTATGITYTPISGAIMIQQLSAGIYTATSASINNDLVIPVSSSLYLYTTTASSSLYTFTDSVSSNLHDEVVTLETSLSASTIVRAVTGGMEDMRIPVWNGTERDLITAHTSAYINPSGDIYATHVYNAVWNDIADFIEVDCPIEYGYVYIMDEEYKVRKSRNYMEPGIIGISSDTYGFGLGNKNGKPGLMPISIGGFVLAHVDDIYLSGTPLTCGIDGILTKIDKFDKEKFPENIVATFFKPESEKTWNGIIVNNRHWVKVK